MRHTGNQIGTLNYAPKTAVIAIVAHGRVRTSCALWQHGRALPHLPKGDFPGVCWTDGDFAPAIRPGRPQQLLQRQLPAQDYPLSRAILDYLENGIAGMAASEIVSEPNPLLCFRRRRWLRRPTCGGRNHLSPGRRSRANGQFSCFTCGKRCPGRIPGSEAGCRPAIGTSR